MRELLIVTNDKFAQIDDEDYDRCSNFPWYLTGSAKFRVSTIVTGKTISLANFVMETDLLYDHKDRNSYNNQKSNLRICTQQQNSMNREKPLFRATTSQYKGVSWSNTPRLGKKRWKAGIKYNGRHIHLGYHLTEHEAAVAYNVAAKKYFKEFAFFNEVSNLNKKDNKCQ